MKNLFYSLLLACVLFSCKESSALEPDDPKGEEFKEEFGEVYGSHLWTYANTILLDTYLPTGTKKVAVYGVYCNRLYKFAEVTTPSSSQTLMFNAPIDLTEYQMVVDGTAYDFHLGDTLDFRSGRGRDADTQAYDQAEMFPWIVAADTHQTSDYDFNDLVARFVPQPDGSLDITAMASGMPQGLWLHFTDGFDDYIISPRAKNGYAEKTSGVHAAQAIDLQWQNWFCDDEESMSASYGINTLDPSGSNWVDGRTVRLPQSLIGELWLSNICASESHKEKGDKEYARPVYGFYVTSIAFDIDRIKGELFNDEPLTYRDCIMCVWPAGAKPQMIVFPDCSSLDSPEQYVGWPWPSEASRIDLVYPGFVLWVSDPDHCWFAAEPSGWNNSMAQFDDHGQVLTFGYYPRILPDNGGASGDGNWDWEW